MKADIVIIPETQDDTSDQLIDKDTQDDIPDTLAETQDTSDKNQDQKNGEKRGKETDTLVPEDQAEDSIETLKVLFGDTLLQYIDKRTERGKTNFKWDGEPSQLKDFITLILKRNGQWKPRKAGAGKQMCFFFQDKSENITLNFWQSSKTLTVQGNEDQTAKIEEQLDNLVNSMRPELKKIEAQNTQSKKGKKENKQQPPATKRNEGGPVSVDSGKEIAALWEVINEVKTLILFQKTSANPDKYNQEAVTEKEAEMTDRMIQLENENAKLTGELEHVKALNLELLKMINNQPRKDTELITVNKKLEAELAQAKLLNNELIKLINKSSFQQEQQEPNVMTPPSPTERVKVDPTEKTPCNEKKPKKQQQQQQKQETKKQSEEKSKKEQQQDIKTPEKTTATSMSKKPSIFIAGDSMMKNIKGWLLSRRKHVRTYTFPGATTEEMEIFLKPLIARRPEEIILYTGTNDLSSKTAEQVTGNILKLVAEIEKHGIKCTVSTIINRQGELGSKVHLVNEQLCKKLKTKNCTYICNKNISLNNLNNGGLHLNKRGDGALALNLINHIRS